MADDDLIELTVAIVSAHVSNNEVSTDEVTGLIQSVFAALAATAAPAEIQVPKQEPAVPVRASVKPDYIVCLEDGKKLKTLKRYLRSNYNMSPDEYRSKWGLPGDYPMVSPDYAEKRKAMAIAMGLGRKISAASETVVEPIVEPVTNPVKAGRKKLGIVIAKSTAAADLRVEKSPPAAKSVKRRKMPTKG